MMSEKQIDDIIGDPNCYNGRSLKGIVIETTNQLHKYYWGEIDKIRVEDGVLKIYEVPDKFLNKVYEEVYINIEDISSIRLCYDYINY